MVTKSLAGTDRQYVPAQAKLLGTTLHLQVQGTPGNRDYGYMIDLPVPEGAAAWFAEGVAITKPSMNSPTGDPSYGDAQVRACSEPGEIKIQIRGSSYNRSYGGTFEFKGCQAFKLWLAAQEAGAQGPVEDQPAPAHDPTPGVEEPEEEEEA